MPWYIVKGFYVQPHGGPFLQPRPQPFESYPVEAGTPEEAIEKVFQSLNEEFEENEKKFERAMALLDKCAESEDEDLTDEENDAIGQQIFSHQPVNKPLWSAREILTEEARRLLADQPTEGETHNMPASYVPSKDNIIIRP